MLFRQQFTKLIFQLKFKNLPLVMVFNRKFLCGGQMQSYLHVKILIIVCPNRICKNFENMPADKVFMAKMNFE